MPLFSLDESSVSLWMTASSGTEACVKRELARLGYEAPPFVEGRGELMGTWKDVARLNIHLAVGDRVLLRLGEFPHVKDFDTLFELVHSYPWPILLPFDAQVTLWVKSIQSQLSSLRTIQSVADKAIVQRMQEHYHTRQRLPKSGARYQIELRLVQDTLTLSLNTSGPGLNRRSYRAASGDAPLRETLAAAMLDLSFWKPGRPLLDCFTGSGTILIEAARRARKIAPGLQRDFDFAHWTWPGFPEFQGKQLLEEARREAQADIVSTQEAGLDLTGYEIDPEVCEVALHNAKLAGVAEDIHFVAEDFRMADFSRPGTVIISNPPYGERLGKVPEVIKMMRFLGERLRENPYLSLYLLTDDTFLEREIGRKADKRRKLYSGNKEVTLYCFASAKVPPKEPTEAISAEPEKKDKLEDPE